MSLIKIMNKNPVKMASIIIKKCYTDQLIYDSKDLNFFTTQYKKVLIYNRQFQNKCKLLAKIETLDGTIIEKNSDNIVKIIGQKQFEILFMALCSVINQEFRIKGLLSILTTVQNNGSDDSNGSQHNKTIKVNVQCQTDEIRINTSDIKKRRIRKHLAPYVVPDSKPREQKIRKVINIPNNGTKKQNEQNNEMTKTDGHNKLTDLPDLGPDALHDENTNDTMISSFSFSTTDEIMKNPLSILKDVEDHTLSVSEKDTLTENLQQVSPLNKTTEVNSLNNTTGVNSLNNSNPLEVKETLPLHSYILTFPDRTSISLPMKPEDPFHIVTRENLKYVDKLKLIELQRKIDEKLCYHPVDDEENLPIHMATLYNDLELLKRQCFILNKKNETVDILANNLTALKLSLFQPTVDATAILLQFNADPLYVDDGHASYFHIAAELKTEHLSVLLEYCKNNARRILSENEELQSAGWDAKPDNEISDYLLDHICSMCDNQGYTPLMLASNLGLYENVKVLLEASKKSVNKQMPNTGNTALYVAVSAICNARSGRNNKSKLVDHFKWTIESLLQNGADPTIDNYVGSNVTLLLTEFPMIDLITIFANNTRTKSLLIKNNFFNGLNLQNLMLVKENENIKVQNINTNVIKKKEVKNVKPTTNTFKFRKIAPKLPSDNNPQQKNISILKNVVIKSPQTNVESTKTTISNPQSTNSLKSIQESSKIMKPILISQKNISISNDNNFIFLSTGKSTNTDSIVATQSTNSVRKIRLTQKKMIVIKRSIKKIDLDRETKINNFNVIKRKNEDDIPSTSNKLIKE